ncbi:MAG: hypothetical protein ABSG68_01630 [Thermoguttaceae bacterium]|jgi:hypothetical protein
MARDNNTFAKRQRETLKKQKAEAKRERRKKRKEEPAGGMDVFPKTDRVADETLEP